MKEGYMNREKKELHFSDIDEPLRIHYVKNIMVLILGFFCALILSITVKQLQIFLVSSLIIAIYGCVICFQIYQVLSQKVMYYTGVCTNIHYRNKKKLFDVDYMLIQNNTDQMLLRVVPHSRKEMQHFTPGDTIRIYSTINGDKLPKINNNTFSVPSYYFMCCLQTCVTSHIENANDSKQ